MKVFSKLFVLSLILIVSCSVEDPAPDEQANIDRDLILEYIAANNLDAKEDSSGVFYVIEDEGGVTRPDQFSTVTMNYRGILLDGEEFDSTYNDDPEEEPNPLTINLQSTIRGWQIGVPFFKKGGRGILLIPSGLAYGRFGRQGIPANAVLVFEQLELVDFE